MGLNSLVVVAEEPPGDVCSDGGKRLDAGVDANANGELDEDEIESTSYLCAGEAGKNALVRVEEEGAGENCAFGGQRIESGTDLDDSGELDASEVLETSYVCSPPADALLAERHAWARTAREPFLGLLSHTLVESAPVGSGALTLKRIASTPRAEEFDSAAAEIVAVNPSTAQVFTVDSSVEVVRFYGLAENGALGAASVLTVTGDVPEATGINSLAIANDTLAVALEVRSEAGVHQNGRVALYDIATTTPDFLGAVTVGAQPDMVTFTHDGTRILTANEGEPPEDYSADPEGSVSIVTRPGAGWPAVTNGDVTTLGFSAFNVGGERAAEFPQEIRPVGPETSTRSQQLEPEYVAVAPDDASAWVVLQEQNAVAVIDLESPAIESIRSLGVKDALKFGNEFDASDRDDAVRLSNWPIYMMYQPDGMQAYEADGQVYYVTANEGDVRSADDWAWGEEARVSSLDLDPVAFPGKEHWQDNAFLGRLQVTTTAGDADGDGSFENLYAFGARSFSIFDAEGTLVFDSGNQFEAITAKLYDGDFNNNHASDDPDGRSDAKGPEPEALLVAPIGDQVYAFIGLERMGGVMVYDITDPEDVEFVTYFHVRSVGEDPEEEDVTADLGPEGFAFLSAAQSPTGKPLLISGNEVSGNTSVYEITAAP